MGYVARRRRSISESAPPPERVAERASRHTSSSSTDVSSIPNRSRGSRPPTTRPPAAPTADGAPGVATAADVRATAADQARSRDRRSVRGRARAPGPRPPPRTAPGPALGPDGAEFVPGRGEAGPDDGPPLPAASRGVHRRAAAGRADSRGPTRQAAGPRNPAEGNLALLKSPGLLRPGRPVARHKTNDPRLRRSGLVYYKMGTLLRALGQREEADQAFDRSLDPSTSWRRTGRGSRAISTNSSRSVASINPWQTDPADAERRLRRGSTGWPRWCRLRAAVPDDLGYLRARLKLLAKLGLIRYQQRHDRVDEPFREASSWPTRRDR